MITRIQAKIAGRVQGVGFRPTVYRYATALGLAGWVRNDPHGVILEVEGEDATVARFFRQLEQEPPRQARITGMERAALPIRGENRFTLIESESAGAAEVHIAPDLATCEDCLRELEDPADRRHAYPFINCTNCGPRFTILRELPYDRPNTSMAGFNMCPPCAHEYHDPADRRFHAQPDACPDCGPRLRLLRASPLPGRVEPPARPSRTEPGTTPPACAPDAADPADQPYRETSGLSAAVALLRAGQVVALKSLGGFHLACSLAAIPSLRARKHRPHKPLAVMFRDIPVVRRYCQLTEAEEADLLSAARPIVILRTLSSTDHSSTGHSSTHHSSTHQLISPDTSTIGAFLPYTPLHHLLLREFDALVMSSGNRAEEPIASTDDELPDQIADAVLTHDRPILHKCDDSVVRLVNGQRQFLRRARGFVPNPIRFAPASPHILAVGGELKNTFCLARDGWAFLSQHIGDLKELATIEYFEREIAEWQRLMRVAPAVIAHDLHPGYLSTQWAEKTRAGAAAPLLIGVQHHHAHVVSVMAEHQLEGEVIGVALDGTGYGPDGTIWGGEFLVATRAQFERFAHFKTYRLPGSEAAIQQPWRMAASVRHAEGLLENPAPELIGRLIQTGFNSPWTTSAGRFFDAAAALLGLCDTISYEGQAAIRLESAADPSVTGHYPFELTDQRVLDFGDALQLFGEGLPTPPQTRTEGLQRLLPRVIPSVSCGRSAVRRTAGSGDPRRAADSSKVLDFGGAIRGLLADRQHVGLAAARFHNTIVAGIVRVCETARTERGLQRVALSGGVFQNEWILTRTTAALRAAGFAVYTNVAVPPNDGGLALGQAAVAAARWESELKSGAVKSDELKSDQVRGTETKRGQPTARDYRCV